MVEQNKRRASGETGAAEESREAADALEAPLGDEAPGEAREEQRKWRTPAFMRMRFNWASPEEREVIEAARHEAQRAIVVAFSDAYAIMGRIYDIVREPVLDQTGKPVRDRFGLVEWKRDPDGYFVEDFTKLTKAQKESFLGSITTALFSWEQRSADMWADALFSKAQFEERFAISYDEPLRGTVDDRQARGNREAAEERYFAIYMSTLSRKADAITRSMDRLGQRLKDILLS